LIFVSTSAFDFRIGEYFALNEKLPDIPNLELGFGFSSREAHDFCSQEGARDGHSFLIHNYFPPPENPFVLNLASIDRDILDKSLSLCRQAIDIGAELGIPYYSVHSGFSVDPMPERLGNNLIDLPRFNLGDAYGIFLESVDSLADYARARGLRLLLENNVIAEQNTLEGRNELFLMCCLEDFMRFDQDFRQDNVGFLLDLGHLKVSANSLGYDKFKAIDFIADRVEAFHLHDNNGLDDQHLPFREDAWFFDVLHLFKGKADFIVEGKHLSLPQIKDQTMILVEKLELFNGG
jgi:sugar phosphate isomerase/epimerase